MSNLDEPPKIEGQEVGDCCKNCGWVEPRQTKEFILSITRYTCTFHGFECTSPNGRCSEHKPL